MGPYNLMKVSSNSNYTFRQMPSQKTECLHRMQLRPSEPPDIIDDRQVNQKHLYPDANAADNFDENLPSAPDDASNDKPEQEMAEANRGSETPTFYDINRPEVAARRTEIRHDTPLSRHRQILGRSQNAPIEPDGNQHEHMP